LSNSNGKIEREARLRWVPLGKTKVSPVAQRALNPARVDRLYAEFDLEQFGTPTVSERDGSFYVIDGQHRIGALIAWLGEGWENQQIQCWAYQGLTEEEEADKFDRLNDVLAVHAFDKFRVRITAGRDVESDIDRIVRSLGLCISRDTVPGAISAVGTLRRVYARSDGPTLSRALRVIRDSYGDPGLEAPVIDGIGLLCQRYNGELSEDAAIEKLKRANGGVNGLLGKAEQLRQRTGNYKSHCVAAAAVDIINTGKGGKKLPSWWKASE
jgi:hypothetical protein